MQSTLLVSQEESTVAKIFQNALPLLTTFCRQSLQHFARMAVAAMCSAVAPVLKGFTASEKAAAHYWQCFETRFAIRFCSLVTLRSLLSCSQGLVRRTLCVREAPTRSRTSQKMKATSFLISRALVVQFPLLLCTKESAVARFSKRIASAGHFLSPKSPAFCNNGRCRHVLSCGPRFDRVCFCLGEKICALLADVCRPFSQVGDIKTLLSNLQSVRALSEEPLREASPKNQDIPETESNQSLVSAKLLMCSFRSCSAPRESAVAKISTRQCLCGLKLATFCLQSTGW